ncbi:MULTISPECIES: histidine triad nucleotide-binding protein [Silvimonas]|uniref:histidine triad nucleotide-binding protein n=1 Tax=Silvimonas TaxID=300264 RepID=UPI0024B35156|nr:MULTISPECIES: histidine triad nucleotide-binding protein [Silvimonas]MDR3425875.1 histidine triad nucleotide-binding protein [Silvimonas sp.]
MTDCLFCKLASGEIPSKQIYEDDEVVAFHDIHPVAPVHFLIVPKVHIDSLAHALPRHQALLGKMLLLAPQLADEHGLADGFRTVINTGHAGGQTFFHLHVHVFGGNAMTPNLAEIKTQ